MTPPPPPGGPRRWPIVVAVLAGVAVIGLVLVAVLAARSGDDGDTAPNRGDPDRPTTSLAPETTASGETTAPDGTEPPSDLRPGPVDGPGEEVIDEARGWAMVVDPAWTEADLGFTEAAWYFGSSDDPSADNVNLLIEELGARMPPSLEAYVDASLQGLEMVFADADVLRRDIVTADDGTRLAILEYAVEYEGLDLHIVQVIIATSDRGAAATFTTMADDPAGVVEQVLPYLLSLRLR